LCSNSIIFKHFYGIRGFITATARTFRLSLSRNRPFHNTPSCLSKILLHFIFPSTSWSSKWCLSFNVRDQVSHPYMTILGGRTTERAISWHSVVSDCKVVAMLLVTYIYIYIYNFMIFCLQFEVLNQIMNALHCLIASLKLMC
jgi:hypothetical protein